METATFNDFKNVLLQLMQWYCARHLQVRDEEAIDKCDQKICILEKQ